MLRLYTEFSLKNTFFNTQFFKILLFILKRKLSLYFVPLICRFLNSEKSSNFSSLIGEIFVKSQNFDSYDVMMTSFAN